ncbi:NADH:flavin oxidoreductase/NADH oxidase-like protein [Calycina marina]|uniref:NADH:flavin oxidoreductase/NADH oxidase-like protein n=1 Tax=Calycina marina TaxID=1763456 RepID=A0A9P7YWK3_9HELO|nr:NADH:flavin oxidoreductase/NADH oxidase-like protein [Calycina marina]
MLLAQELSLPCGLTLPNRICKAALAENMAPANNPDEKFPKAYAEWAKGGYGLIMTGNVQVTNTYLGAPGDISVPSPATASYTATKEDWTGWATATQQHGTPAIVQLNHPGRQSPAGAGSRWLWAKNLAPSAVSLNLGPRLFDSFLSNFVFGKPRAMTVADIEGVVQMFVDGAKMAEEAGFKGVELHAAHGYLLAQFMAPSSNKRDDEFGGTAAKRVKLILLIMKAIRASTKPGFCVGIKLNSVDVSSGNSMEETLEQVRLIVEAGIDFIEISGGSYENPVMMQEHALPEPTKSARSLARESFFLKFAQSVRARFPTVLLMVTGGFRTRAGMEAALNSGGCDLIGIGRPTTVIPYLPKDIILNEQIPDADADLRLKDLPSPWYMSLAGKVIGAGAQSTYYAGQILRMGKGLKPIDTRLGVTSIKI